MRWKSIFPKYAATKKLYAKIVLNYFRISPKINRSNLVCQKNVSTLLSEIARDSVTKFGLQLADCKNDTEGQENAYIERANRNHADLSLLKAGDDYWKKAIHCWAQGQQRCEEHLAVYVGYQIEEI
jgi:ribosome biogenesis protein Tsr3